MVINLAQVVAALAAGALLTLTLFLILERHGPGHRAGQDVCQQGAEYGVGTDIPQTGHDDEEWLIEATRHITVDSFEALRQRDGDDGGPSAPEALQTGSGRPPHGMVVVRSKGHLKLIGSAVAVLVTVCTAARDALRQHPSLTSAAIGTVATATAVTTLTITPWTSESDARPPQPSVSAPTIQLATPAQPWASATRLSRSTSAAPSASPMASQASPSPTPNASGSSAPLLSPSPELPAASLSAGQTASTTEPAPAHSPGAGHTPGGVPGSPPPGSSARPPSPGHPPAEPSGPTTKGLCARADARSLPDGACAVSGSN